LPLKNKQRDPKAHGLTNCRRLPPALVAFGDYDATRLWQFAIEHCGALVDGWKLFGAASLFNEAR
jgi:hypothetical protein